MRSGPELYAWLDALPVAERDGAIERALGIDVPVSTAPPGEHLVGHHMMSVSAIVRAIHDIPIRAEDIVVDLGSGLGKVTALVRLLTGARTRGIEIQPELVARAAALPGVSYECGDARTASLEDATVIIMYCPFSGPVLDAVSRRLDAHPNIVVCAAGVDLRSTRLLARPSADFWSTIWDDGAPREPVTLSPVARRLAHDEVGHPPACDPAIPGISPLPRV